MAKDKKEPESRSIRARLLDDEERIRIGDINQIEKFGSSRYMLEYREGDKVYSPGTGGVPDESTLRKKIASFIESIADISGRYPSSVEVNYTYSQKPDLDSKKQEPDLETKVCYLNLSNRLQNILDRGGVDLRNSTVKQLAEWAEENGEDGLLNIRNFGRTSLLELREKFRRYGRELNL